MGIRLQMNLDNMFQYRKVDTGCNCHCWWLFVVAFVIFAPKFLGGGEDLQMILL